MPLLNYLKVNMLTVHFGDCEPCSILPGINQVSDIHFERLQKHPSFNNLIKEGKIVLLKETKVKDGKQEVNEMLSYIPKIYDTKLLRKIIKEDGRELVVSAAKDQLDSIITVKSKDEEQGNEHFK